MNIQWLFPSRELHIENEAVILTPIDIKADFEQLYQAASFETNQEDLFRYHVNVPIMSSQEIFENYLYQQIQKPSQVLYKVYSKRLGSIIGSAALMNVQVSHGSVEVGSIWYAKRAQRTEINTNAMYLLFSYVFDQLKFRRLEWKCNSKNAPSRRAALRLGFEYEGLFRQHYLSRGENRDTAWYSIIDSEWPVKKSKLEEKLGYLNTGFEAEIKYEVE